MIDLYKVTAEELNAMLPYGELSKRGVARRIVRFFRTNGTFGIPEYKVLYENAFDYLCNDTDTKVTSEIRPCYKDLVGKFDRAPFFTKADVDLFL